MLCCLRVYRGSTIVKIPATIHLGGFISHGFLDRIFFWWSIRNGHLNIGKHFHSSQGLVDSAAPGVCFVVPRRHCPTQSWLKTILRLFLCSFSSYHFVTSFHVFFLFKIYLCFFPRKCFCFLLVCCFFSLPADFVFAVRNLRVRSVLKVFLANLFGFKPWPNLIPDCWRSFI